MSQKVNIVTFTDPMMGLSYECEPIFRKLETHFADEVEFKYLMCVLVKDVYDLVNPADLSISKELAIKNYNAKLSKIYESEEDITGMPINMTDFQLFSVEHTSSLPLNLAYKAVQLIDDTKADLFLYNLRYATIVECRPTMSPSRFERQFFLPKKQVNHRITSKFKRLLKNNGREPAEFAMRANKIVVTLNVSEDGSFSLTSSSEILEEGKFALQAAEEILSNGVIIRIAFT